MASRVGFEPTTKGLKVPCSATELPARGTLLSLRTRQMRSPPYRARVLTVGRHERQDLPQRLLATGEEAQEVHRGGTEIANPEAAR